MQCQILRNTKNWCVVNSTPFLSPKMHTLVCVASTQVEVCNYNTPKECTRVATTQHNMCKKYTPTV